MYRSGRVLGPKYYLDLRCSRTTRNTAEGDGDKESNNPRLRGLEAWALLPAPSRKLGGGAWEAGPSVPGKGWSKGGCL